MNSQCSIGTQNNPLRIGVVGAGPAGFHTAMALLDQADVAVAVDLVDRLPTPYGLVRSGVAPDHQRIKGVTRVYERLAQDPRFRFYGNVELGRDISVKELCRYYDQVVYATGNESDRRLGVAGEHLTGCVPGAVFVGWYNGHPDFKDAEFDLSCERAVIVGNGNVAVDIARILAKSPADLIQTDIADHALHALTQSRIREIVVVGRRGPLQASFAPAELKELSELSNVALHVDADELELDEHTAAELEQMAPKSHARRNLELLREMARRPNGPSERNLRLRFLLSPREFLGDQFGRLTQVRLQHNRLVRGGEGSITAEPTDRQELMEVGMALVSVGFESRRIAELPYDAKRGTISNIDGRVVALGTGEWLRNQYCAGWARTGAQGLIAAQKIGALEIASRILEDFRNGSVVNSNRSESVTIKSFLAERQIRWISFDDWRIIDRVEIQRGDGRGAPRSKFVDIPSMIAQVELERRGW